MPARYKFFLFVFFLLFFISASEVSAQVVIIDFNPGTTSTAGLFVVGGLGFMGVAAYRFLREVKKRYNVQNEGGGLGKENGKESL